MELFKEAVFTVEELSFLDKMVEQAKSECNEISIEGLIDGIKRDRPGPLKLVGPLLDMARDAAIGTNEPEKMKMLEDKYNDIVNTMAKQMLTKKADITSTMTSIQQKLALYRNSLIQ